MLAASRSRGRGRRWTPETVRAALELLASGTTDRVQGSTLSRLRSRLRASDAQELAYHVIADRATLWRALRREDARAAELSGTGAAIAVGITSDAVRYARRERFVQDLDGQTVLLELDTDATEAAEAIVLYAYGDERTSSAARSRIEAMIARLA